MIATRRGNHTRGGNRSREQVGKRASWLERPGVLAQFELEGEAIDGQTEIAPARLDDGGLSDVGPNEMLGCGDQFGGDVVCDGNNITLETSSPRCTEQRTHGVELVAVDRVTHPRVDALIDDSTETCEDSR